MATPDIAERVFPEPTFEGLPHLPLERPEHYFEPRQPVMAVHYRTWMENGPEMTLGRITDVWTDTRPFMLRLSSDVDREALSASVIETADMPLKEEELAVAAQELKKTLNSEPLRRFMLNAVELRPYMPSPGFANLEVPKTDGNRTGRIIGVDLNHASLIPMDALPHLLNDTEYREAWVTDIAANSAEKRDVIEEAILSYDPPVPVQDTPAVQHAPRRARRHTPEVNIPRSRPAVITAQ